MSLSSFELRIVEWLSRKTPPVGVRRAGTLLAAVATDVGAVRQDNQDRVAIARGRDALGREYVVLALADGIGGMSKGAECAALTIASVFTSIHFDSQSRTDPSTWLPKAATRANVRVHRELRGHGGSTLVAALVMGDRKAHWLSVGDSRVHIARRNELIQISTDDTIAGQLGRPAEAGLDRSQLLQFIGVGPTLEPHIGELAPPAPGALVLTSDGVHFVDAKWLGAVVGNAPDIGSAARRLIDTARFGGGPDNASVAAISFPEQLGLPMPGPTEGSLDLWDAFGELSLFGFPGPIVAAATPSKAPVAQERAPPQVSPAAPSVPAAEEPPPAETPEQAAATAATPEQPVATTAATPAAPISSRKTAKGETPRREPAKKRNRRSSGSSKGKASADAEDGGLGVEGDRPQLVIEFPKKAN
jgi:serine/threonine protein phosphatase PrpC